jgi:hypothetical protein
MRERARSLMRTFPGWIEDAESRLAANSVWRFRDTMMTIEPNGDWHCEGPHTNLTVGIATGNVNNLEQFLREFAAENR